MPSRHLTYKVPIGSEETADRDFFIAARGQSGRSMAGAQDAQNYIVGLDRLAVDQCR